MQRSLRREVVHHDVQRLAPSQERHVVGGVETGAHHGQDRPDETLRLPQGQAEDESERQGSLDRQLLPARSTGRWNSLRSPDV